MQLPSHRDGQVCRGDHVSNVCFSRKRCPYMIISFVLTFIEYNSDTHLWMYNVHKKPLLDDFRSCGSTKASLFKAEAARVQTVAQLLLGSFMDLILR